MAASSSSSSMPARPPAHAQLPRGPHAQLARGPQRPALRVATYNLGGASPNWGILQGGQESAAWGDVTEDVVELACSLDMVFLTEMGNFAHPETQADMLRRLGQRLDDHDEFPDGYQLTGGVGPFAVLHKTTIHVKDRRALVQPCSMTLSLRVPSFHSGSAAPTRARQKACRAQR